MKSKFKMPSSTMSNVKRSMKEGIFPTYGEKRTVTVSNNKTMTKYLLPCISVFLFVISSATFAYSDCMDDSREYRGHRSRHHHGYSSRHHGMYYDDLSVSELQKERMPKKEIFENLEKLGYKGENAIKEFQLDYDLVPDGIVGRRTAHLIKSLLKVTSNKK